MDYKMFAVGLFAVIGSYLILSMPMAFATDVSIYHNGQQMGSAQISPQNMVNKQVVISHQESDVTWTDTKVLVRVSTASLAYSIKKIYLYKCKKLDPNACMQTMPQSFDNWVDTELAWSDISEQAGQSSYPQVANILVLVKLEGANSRTSWMAFWDTIKRLDYNVFNQYSYEIGSIDVYAKSADLVQPIQSYIGNFQMVPFNWVSKVVFSSASVLYGGGGDSQDLNKPQPDLETAQTANQITAINKEFYFIFSNISSGITNALTMNLNPSFTCGDNKCEADLGETQASCCYDCDCDAGSYCDISSGTQGGCRLSNDTTLSVIGYTVPTPLQQCNAPVGINVTARINSPPSNLPASINGIFRINSTQYPVACTGSGGTYNCPLRVPAPVSCGFGSFFLGPNTLNMSMSYRDGANTVYKDMSTQFSNINVNFDCGCQANFYCDVGPNVCRSEGSIMLQVLSVDSYLDNFTGANDMVKSVLRIVNTPTNFTANAFTFNFGNITWGTNSVPASSPTVNCINAGVAGSSYAYNCSPTLTIPSYNPNESYVVRSNSVNASITFTDGGIQKQNVLSARFGDIIVPQQSCGNGRVDPRETQSNCCRDAGCGDDPGNAKYCDVQNGCQYKANISATVLNVDPANVSDCTIPHVINFTVRINNAPSDARLNFFSYLRNSLVQAWPMQCSQPSYMTGIVSCYMTMPQQSNCTLPYSRIDGNSINLSVSFRNGDREMLVREMNAPFGDLLVMPAWHCGNRACEDTIGENAGNCCIDCTCKNSTAFGPNFYCNYDPQNTANGTCEAKSNITLVIDRPTATVFLKSCEYNNRVNIKAHIDNQPASMALENFFGTFNSGSAELYCVREAIFPGSANFSINCTMLVPPEGECTQGVTYRYANNSLGLFISYRDGLGRVVTQTLVAPIADFSTTQSYRSLYEITNDAVTKMRENVQKSLDLARKMISMMKLCIMIMIVMAVLEVVGTFYVAYQAGKGGPDGKFAWDNVGSEKWKNSVGAMGTASTGLNSIIGNICQMLQMYYQALQKNLQIEGELLKMDVCIQVYQHQLDSGYCMTTGLDGCFNGLKGCIDYGTVNSYMNDLSTTMGKVNGFAQNIGDAIKDVGEAINEVSGGGGGVVVRFSWNDNQPMINNNQICNRYATDIGAVSNADKADSLEVQVIPAADCKYVVVDYTTSESGAGTLVNSQTLIGSSKYKISVDSIVSPTTWYFNAYCFQSQTDYVSKTAQSNAKRAEDIMNARATPNLKIDVLVDSNNIGNCGGGTAAGGSSMTPANVQAVSTLVDQARKLLGGADDGLRVAAASATDKTSAKSSLDNAYLQLAVNFGKASTDAQKREVLGAALSSVNNAKTIINGLSVVSTSTNANRDTITLQLTEVMTRITAMLSSSSGGTESGTGGTETPSGGAGCTSNDDCQSNQYCNTDTGECEFSVA